MPMIALSASTALLRVASHCSVPIQPSCRPFLPSKGSIYSRYLRIWAGYWLLRWLFDLGSQIPSRSGSHHFSGLWWVCNTCKVAVYACKVGSVSFPTSLSSPAAHVLTAPAPAQSRKRYGLRSQSISRQSDGLTAPCEID